MLADLFPCWLVLTTTPSRSWIFRPPAAKAPTTAPHQDQQREASRVYQTSISRDIDIGPADQSQGVRCFPERHLRWSPVALFRFSALTFNAHMIHYNETWTRTVEGHPQVVVHGPLNLINMLDYWRDHHLPKGSDSPRSISYRALSPLYAADDYVIKTTSAPSDRSRVTELSIEKSGVVSMTGTITSSA